ncbi:MAG: 1-hydroxy-2-methyl-2-(E)-butenyl 4-diphosphate synthase [Chitinophagaceae bacterium]|nr:1-hydroxy-2-methyl-2-(E)-butenyl 4-diphosphate synthase [Chitinophagaceae bacterium]
MNQMTLAVKYTESLTAYTRRKTRVVNIGDIPMGGDYPIRLQSMTTTDTMDTQGTVEQCLRMAAAGCEYIRITAPSVKEAENLRNIKDELRKRGCTIPLVADIHFTPNAAEVAARIVEKVRVNPGNYADKKRFETIEYTDSSYQAELDRIREKFVPLVKICQEYGTAMRIGTNHGSLSDRILSRYGDTPLGMVESALEFIRICEELKYYDIVISMKASNTQVMVQAYRLLVEKLDEEGLQPYPLHLGVTEAGEAEDGRIKSAVGIGALLEDGLGDTIRVSLTEEPEYEIPVAAKLAERYAARSSHSFIPELKEYPINPYAYKRRETKEVYTIGGSNVPRVIIDLSRANASDYKDLKSIGHFYLPEPDKWTMNDQGADFVYTGTAPIDFMLPMGLKEIIDYKIWLGLNDQTNKFPYLTSLEALALSSSDKPKGTTFVEVWSKDLSPELIQLFKEHDDFIAVLRTRNDHAMAAIRRIFSIFITEGIKNPCIVRRDYGGIDNESLHLYAATDVGGLLIDGLGDGILLGRSQAPIVSQKVEFEELKVLNALSFGILQAARTRMSKTEYISCPSCGRTLFDLQETTAMIRKRTDHLKGIKIGIMGCIVNGPGEMADADYGYVGVGKGKIALYRGQEVIKKAVPAEQAVDELIELIREDGRWISPMEMNLQF